MRLQIRHQNDLKICSNLLAKARDGISTNRIVDRKLAHIYVSDTCHVGFGAMSMTGRTCRFLIHPDLRNRLHINTLKFFVEFVIVWWECTQDFITGDDCTLSVGDNTSSIGWICGSKFNDSTQHPNQEISRKWAHLSILFKCVNYGQHMSWTKTVCTDSISRDHHIHVDKLTTILNFMCPL